MCLDKDRYKLREKIKQPPLSAATATRRAEMLAEDVQSQLDASIQTAPCIALAVDEATDINDNALLVLYIRFYHAEMKDFIEDILGVTAFTTHQRRRHILSHKRDVNAKRNQPKTCVHHH